MKKISIIAIVCIALVSCKKDKEKECSLCVDAVVRWGGPPAADGLGWYLIADSTRGIIYIPKNLPDSYKVDDLKVNACLSETNEKFYCQCATPYNTYEVKSIRKL